MRNLVVQKGSPQSPLILLNRELTEVIPGDKTSGTIIDDADLVEVLADRFGLFSPRSTRFPTGSVLKPDDQNSARGSRHR